MLITVIRTDGSIERHFRPVGQVIGAIANLIGAATLDTVNLRDGRVMLVDEGGWETVTVRHDPPKLVNGRLINVEVQPVRARKPINALATQLYRAVCYPGTTHQIAGDVAIVYDNDFA